MLVEVGDFGLRQDGDMVFVINYLVLIRLQLRLSCGFVAICCCILFFNDLSMVLSFGMAASAAAAVKYCE